MNEDNKYDALKEIFRRKLENHQLPVEASHWEAINSRLNRKSSSAKKIIILWSAVAASVAIIFAIAFLHYDRGFDQLSENHNLLESSYEYSESQNDKPVSVFDSINSEANRHSSPQLRKPVIASRNDEANRNCKNNVVEIDCFVPHNDDVVQKEPEKQPAEKPGIKSSNNTWFTADPSCTKKRKKEWLLAASFQTNNGVKNNVIVESPHYEVNTRLYRAGDKIVDVNKALIPDNVNGKHSVPLSFGLILRKNIHKHWGVETGLVYTYLSSNYQWNDFTPFDAVQRLHYLGIPVNGVVYLWNNHPKWNVYISAGAMLEKGLRMNVVRNQYLPNNLFTTTQNTNIDGWQWSLNSSAGISYRFADRMKIYFEPRLGYYFDNDQPPSVRTDQPVSIGFGAGLQFSL